VALSVDEVRGLKRSGLVGALTAFRGLIELPEQLGHPVGDRLA
jgi:hypothetical protein